MSTQAVNAPLRDRAALLDIARGGGNLRRKVYALLQEMIGWELFGRLLINE